MLMNLGFLPIFATFLVISYGSTVVVNGGEVMINGVVTDTQIDIMVNYTANVKWLAVIFSKDQVNTDMHLLQVDSSNAANPVQVRDCFIDQNSHIVYDDVNNIQPSITTFRSSIVPYGLKVAYNRDLNTGDLQDKRFYKNDVIQVCFMSSLSTFVGGGYEEGHEKICSFLSLHVAPDYFQERLLGNYAATSLFGGGNLTIYATQSTDEGTGQSWLFLGFVHKQQGLTPYTGKWIGITYKASLANTDMTLVQYAYRDFTTQIHISDMYITDSTLAKKDLDYATNQGGDDVVEVLGALDASTYMVAIYKRKFETGDENRDNDLTSGANTFCFILGNNLEFTTFVQSQRVCLDLTLTTSYYSNFRVKQSGGGSTVIDYAVPQNTVKVIKVYEKLFTIIRIGFLLLMLII